jgi:hypothetical protein
MRHSGGDLDFTNAGEEGMALELRYAEKRLADLEPLIEPAKDAGRMTEFRYLRMERELVLELKAAVTAEMSRREEARRAGATANKRAS